MVTQYRYVEMERKAGFDPSWDFDVIGNVFYQFSIDFHSDIKCCRHRLTHGFKLAAILLLIYCDLFSWARKMAISKLY
jgi:hypothetical protein